MRVIALVDARNGIAKDGKQICFIPDDLKRFRSLTVGHAVIMGRITAESIGKPLPHRRNLVLTHTRAPEGFEAVPSMEEALERLGPDAKDAFVIGGEAIYKLVMDPKGKFYDSVDAVYLTRANEDYGADQFFPELDPDHWGTQAKVLNTDPDHGANGLPKTWTYEVYLKGE